MSLIEEGSSTRILKHKHNLPDGLKLLIIISPLILYILAFNYVPLFGYIIAFFDYKPGFDILQTHFAGLKYFTQIFTNGGDLLRVLRNTLTMSFLGILGSPLPIVFAILLNEIRINRFKKLVQTTTTLPNFISWIVVFGLTYGIFSGEGLYNNLLINIGMNPVDPPGILGNNNAVWIFQWLMGVWKSLGWGAIIYLATISGIDNELYDAAKVDGANRFQVIMNITVPGLYSTYLVLLLLGISNILNNGFDQYFVFFNPLVADRIEVLDYYVYKVGMLTNNYPLSTALGMSKSLISIILLFTANWISRRLRGDSIV